MDDYELAHRAITLAFDLRRGWWPRFEPEDAKLLIDALELYYSKLEEKLHGRRVVPQFGPLTPADRRAAGVSQPGKLEEYIYWVAVQRGNRLSLRAFCEQSLRLVKAEVSYATMRRANKAVVRLEQYRDAREVRGE